METTTPLQQVYKETNIQLKHIIPLDFTAVEELPESHSWADHHAAEDHHHHHHPRRQDNNIVPPVINLRDESATELIGEACKKWGMFQVTGHDVPMGLIDEVEGHVVRLFSLPVERKLKALRSSNGATGYGVARISPFFPKLMWHEGFTMMGSSAFEHAKELWPGQYEEFCDAMDKYQKKMKSLAYEIFLITLKALGVSERDQETIFSPSFNQSEGALQLNSYPKCPNPNRAVGLAPHTDSLLVTILHQNDTNGLQIFQNNTGWITVPRVSGALVVNIGDLMHILSNGHFQTAYHRVVPNETRHRYSIAYFYGPPTDTLIQPLRKDVTKQLRFSAVTVKEYLCLKNKHLEKALLMLETRLDP